MDYRTMKFQEIVDWCKANDQTAWLKEFVTTKVPCKVYPRKTVDGKSVADKTQEPKTEMRTPSYTMVKQAFATKFMPEIIPEKKKSTMLKIVEEL